MGKNIDLQNLLDKRLRLSEEILNVVDDWTGSDQSSIDTIEKIDRKIEDLKEIEEKLTGYNIKETKDERYKNNLEGIIEGKKEIIKAINSSREEILKELKKIQKKGKIVDNYITDEKKSMFIDKKL